MTDIAILNKRSNSKCELCSSTDDLSAHAVLPKEDAILTCSTCLSQIQNPEEMDQNHWRCLNDSMWSEFPAVQVMAWRLLDRLKSESWALDLHGQIYLDDETLKWAELESSNAEATIATKDSNGNTLSTGDTVTLIKDLDVKGANFTAKRGTVVKNISLTDNPEHIEGRVNGTQIVLLTCFLKKA